MNTTNIINQAIRRLLYPLVRVLLRHGVPYAAFTELVRATYVKVAIREFQIAGRKQTVSRVAVLTGLTRKEVLKQIRLSENVESTQTDSMKPLHRVERVISGWVHDQNFLDSRGKPAPLPLEGEEASFEALVRRYSGDMTSRAILDELLRTEVVEQVDGRVNLLRHVYIPRGNEAQKLPILGADVRDLVTAIDHNLTMPPPEAWLQRTVAYDNLSEEFVLRLRSAVTDEGQTFLGRWDKELATHDRDVNPSVEGSGRMRAVIGIYYLEETYLNYSQEQES